jgi:hypothetical protein
MKGNDSRLTSIVTIQTAIQDYFWRMGCAKHLAYRLNDFVLDHRIVQVPVRHLCQTTDRRRAFQHQPDPDRVPTLI